MEGHVTKATTNFDHTLDNRLLVSPTRNQSNSRKSVISATIEDQIVHSVVVLSHLRAQLWGNVYNAAPMSSCVSGHLQAFCCCLCKKKDLIVNEIH